VNSELAHYIYSMVESHKHLPVWDTVEHHSNFTNSDLYGPMIETMRSAFEGAVDDFHVQFTIDPKPILSSPCTQITTVTFKALQDKTHVLQILSGVSQMNPGVVTYGEVIEDENVVIIIRALSTCQLTRH